MNSLKLLILSFLLYSCSSPKMADLDFMLGEWKRENKDLYEVWEKQDKLSFSGYGYRIKNEEKEITETLTLKNIREISYIKPRFLIKMEVHL